MPGRLDGGYGRESWFYVRERVVLRQGGVVAMGRVGYMLWRGKGYVRENWCYIRESGVYVTERVVLHQGQVVLHQGEWGLCNGEGGATSGRVGSM